MKLRIEMDGEIYSLDLTRNGSDLEYQLMGAENASGSASAIEVMPGIFSILLGRRSFQVHLVANGDGMEVWAGGERHFVSVADARDRSSGAKKASAAGPMEIRAQMPGKVIKLLVEPGARVQIGQGMIVVEAMKMQNEMKSPKDGVVSRIHASEGATVLAGEALLVIE